MVIDTKRTRLRCWAQTDRAAFAAMHADPDVMQDYGGPGSRRESPRIGLAEVIADTSIDNLRSQAVMDRLQMRRDPSRDFTADYDTIKGWRGLVWVARRNHA